MYNVLLVEDEKYIREGIKASLEWNEIGLQIIGEAKDGDEGFKMAMELQPDIILADIRMPGMDGLEMSKKILEKRPEVKIIIVSGYDDYKYIRQSLLLGLCDYLMKPVNDEELKDVIQKTVYKIKAEEIKKKHEIEKEQQVTKSSELIKKNKLNKLLKGDLQDDNWRGLEDMESFFSSNDQFIVAILKVENLEILTKELYADDDESIILKLESLCTEIACNYQMVQVMANPDSKREIIIIKGVKTKSNQNVEASMLICFDLIKAIKKNNKYRVNIGIGDLKVGFEGIKKSYKEAVKVINMLNYADSLKVVFYKSYKTDYVEEVFSKYEEMFKKLLDESSVAGANELLNIIYSKLKNDDYYPKIELFRNMNKFLKKTADYSKSKGGLDVELEDNEFNSRIEEFDNFEDVWTWFINRIHQSFEGLNVITNTTELMKKVKEYVDQNFVSDNISLGYLSKRFYINPYRLCKLFKSEYNENFQSYIIKRKIDKAKELLMDSNIKIYEISQLIGYEDVKYFSRIFKKYTGYAPNEYRDQKKISKQNFKII